MAAFETFFLLERPDFAPAGGADQHLEELGIDGQSGLSVCGFHPSTGYPVYTPLVRSLPTALEQALRNHGEKLNLLVVRLGALGDILRTVPAVKLVRRALWRATIRWVVDDRWRGVLDGLTELDQIVVLPRRDWDRRARSPLGWPGLLREVGAFRSQLRESHTDLVLDFHGNLRSGWVGWLTGAPVRLGYGGHQQKEANHWFSTHRVAAGARRTPRMERNLDLIRALGLPDRPLPVGELPLARAGAAEADRIFEELCGSCGPVAVIAPGVSAAQAYKKPPAALLAAASRRLAGGGVAPLIVWGPGEEPDARRVVELAPHESILAPPTNLRALAGLLAKARLFVGGDSGPLHLACALGCPVIGLYGPTDPVVNGPWGVPSRSVFPQSRVYTGIKRYDRRAGGFAGLDAAQVESAVDQLLDETASRT